ncbi:WcaI family glycosyltransferase [Thalassotalea euphylliae]|uniref:Colanic acid biosynthesis glycosyltransferase WcaI n=1 Tax=Thalassotalea euphylliae TaxID=1655234 RepID=A0A3E0U5T3_9GAMM|nr:WcaI family glycosyltransferase [Thalassotalea euphylliae]REL31947.1 colanic acid biosynthesis glycosyltransferase WcaI [Thalassotalea euphylliae]
MKLLLLSLNHAPELTGIGKYNGELVDALSAREVTSYVVTAPPYYPDWQRHKGYKNWWSSEQDGEFVEVYRCPLYVPSKPSTLKRLLHLASFALSSACRLLTLLSKKPDVVFVVQPSLFCAPVALLYSKLTGAKSVLHIQDFEVDAMFGLGMSKSSVLKRWAQAFETFLMKRFDIVSSISFSMLERAKSKGAKDNQLHYFPNWADLAFVTPSISGESLRARWQLETDDYVVLYSGNVGEKQGLEIILDAAQAMRDQTTANKPKVKFIIIGNGANRLRLEEQASVRGLTNIQFKPLQPWELMPQILAMADLHLVVQKRGAADAVLPSKLTNILSAGGHALVTAEADTELGKIAEKFPGIYDCIEPENPALFVDALNKLAANGRQKANIIARQYAEQNMDINSILDSFTDRLAKS